MVFPANAYLNGPGTANKTDNVIPAKAGIQEGPAAWRDAQSAITGEKQLNKWESACKMRLIEQSNPEWLDLYGAICVQTGFPPSRE
jgi:hypothetical protein